MPNSQHALQSAIDTVYLFTIFTIFDSSYRIQHTFSTIIFGYAQNMSYQHKSRPPAETRPRVWTPLQRRQTPSPGGEPLLSEALVCCTSLERLPWVVAMGIAPCHGDCRLLHRTHGCKLFRVKTGCSLHLMVPSETCNHFAALPYVSRPQWL